MAATVRQLRRALARAQPLPAGDGIGPLVYPPVTDEQDLPLEDLPLGDRLASLERRTDTLVSKAKSPSTNGRRPVWIFGFLLGKPRSSRWT